MTTQISNLIVFAAALIVFASIIGIDYYSWCKKKRHQKRCANGVHRFGGWRYKETTHYGDKDLYDRTCHHCGIVDITISRLEP